MLPTLTTQLLSQWETIAPDQARPATIAFLGIPGSIEGGTTTFLGFLPNATEPLFAVKIHRNTDHWQRGETEKTLLTLMATCDGGITTTVPRLLFAGSVDGHWMNVQTILPGQPMLATMTSEGTPELTEAHRNMALAIDWLRQFHVATGSRAWPMNLPTFITQRIVDYRRHFAPSKTEEHYLARLPGLFAALPTFGCYYRHGDYCRHNLLVAKEGGTTKVRAIDWTFSQLVSAPCHDLFFFTTSYFLQVRKVHGIVGFLQAFAYTYFEPNPYAECVREQILTYTSALGIDPGALRPLFALFLIEQALFEHQQLTQAVQRGDLPRFAVTLAMSEGLGLEQLPRAQLWPNFFRYFVEHEDRCTI